MRVSGGTARLSQGGLVNHEASNGNLTFATADPVFAVDQELRVTLWNEAAEALLGYKTEEVLGKHCHDLFGCRDRGDRILCHRNCMDSLLKQQQEMMPAQDFQVRTKDGREIWASISAILMPSARRDSTILVHIFRDISHQKETEQLIEQILTSLDRLAVRTGNNHSGRLPTPSALASLTEREREVLRVLTSGASTRAIAKKLSISPATARHHVENILTKLGVRSRLEAVSLVLKNNHI